MNFLWGGSPKPGPPPKFVETPPSSAREFAENTKELDLELQALLKDTSIAAPEVTQVPPAPKPAETKIPPVKANGAKSEKKRAAPVSSSTTEQETDAKLTPEPKLWFGVPRKYVVVVLIILFMVAIITRLMASIWGASDLSTTVVESNRNIRN